MRTAAKKGELFDMQRLIDSGVDADAADEDGRTAMWFAAQGDKAVVVALRKARASFDCADAFGQTPLMRAAQVSGCPIREHSAKAVVRLFLSWGVNHVPADDKGMTALHFAVKQGNEEVAKMLASAGADVNRAATHVGVGLQTPLMTAACAGFASTVQWLLAQRAERTAKDALGRTALRIAAQEGQEDVVAVLVEGFAPDLDQACNAGITPLLAAAQGCQTAVMKQLLKKGADHAVEDHHGRTALQIVREGRADHPPIIQSELTELQGLVQNHLSYLEKRLTAKRRNAAPAVEVVRTVSAEERAATARQAAERRGDIVDLVQDEEEEEAQKQKDAAPTQVESTGERRSTTVGGKGSRKSGAKRGNREAGGPARKKRSKNDKAQPAEPPPVPAQHGSDEGSQNLSSTQVQEKQASDARAAPSTDLLSGISDDSEDDESDASVQAASGRRSARSSDSVALVQHLWDVAVVSQGKRLVSGDLVWAKFEDEPWWPGQLSGDPDDSDRWLRGRARGPPEVRVIFFGGDQEAWLPVRRVKPFMPFLARYRDEPQIQKALEEALAQVADEEPLSDDDDEAEEKDDEDLRLDDDEDGVAAAASPASSDSAAVLAVGSRVRVEFTDKSFDGAVVKSSRSSFDVKFDVDGEVVTVEPDKHKFKRLPASPEAGGQHELEQQADEPVHGEDDSQSQELQRKRDQGAAFGTQIARIMFVLAINMTPRPFHSILLAPAAACCPPAAAACCSRMATCLPVSHVAHLKRVLGTVSPTSIVAVASFPVSG